LIEYLRTNYDYVIIDTSPVGIVPDSKLIMKYTDINLLLVRQTKTKKNELINTLRSLTSVQVSKFFIVFNDFTPKNGQYNYMYKYYADELFVRPQ
jgi:Mrp family chromosome partitioning ATPase